MTKPQSQVVIPGHVHPTTLPYLDAMAAHRERSESLVRGMEVLVRKYGALEVVPLDVVGRAERLVLELHAANLSRVSRVSQQELEASE